MIDSKPLLTETDFPVISRRQLDTLQVNLGYRCNMSCVHCHVNAGPTRTESMGPETVAQVLRVLQESKARCLDLTGGAPEMNPHFRYLITRARAMGVEVIDRCNLTILLLPEYEGLMEFLADNQVTITASLPCYSEANVTEQRGKGVFDESIEALRELNALGYGKDPDLHLNLVYNPVGPVLPPPQPQLETDYKQQLGEHYGIVFNQLFTITNMPINRFGSVLQSKGTFQQYMDLLKSNFSEANLETVMCRSLLSIDWQGYVYDCDFNQMLDMPTPVAGLIGSDRKAPHIADITPAYWTEHPIVVGDHCYACTAGQGSSCGGALA